MDFISHILIGNTVGLSDKKTNIKLIFKVILFSVLPDIFQIPYYFFLGNLKNRDYNWPKVEDWDGFRGNFPIVDLLWDIPHSFFFLIIIYIILRIFKQPLILLFAYFLHIFIDIFTHTGEWFVKFLFPLKIGFSGITDVWAWDFQYLLLAWCVIILVNLAIYKFIRNQK